MICNFCGAFLRDGAEKCSTCGRPTAPADTADDKPFSLGRESTDYADVPPAPEPNPAPEPVIPPEPPVPPEPNVPPVPPEPNIPPQPAPYAEDIRAKGNDLKFAAKSFAESVAGVVKLKGKAFSAKKLAACAAALVVVIAAAAGLTNALKKHNISKPLKAIEEGLEDCDVERMLEALPDDIADTADSDDIDEAEDDMQDAVDEYAEQAGFDGSFTVSHKILDYKKVKGDSLDRINELYEEAEFDLDMKKCYSADVRFTVEGDNGYEAYITMNISVGKTSDGWKLVDFNELISDYSQYSPLDTSFEYLAKLVASSNYSNDNDFGMLGGFDPDKDDSSDDYDHSDDYHYFSYSKNFSDAKGGALR